VKSIISLHDGHVGAHSDGLGAGSVFTISLKAAEQA
jgi:signal transduction histidine kinase